MATRKVGDLGDLGLIKVLQAMCDKNDHVIVLKVLQTLSSIRRAGYMTIEELVSCLCYCSNIFADKDNYTFFEEFAEYMPDITAFALFSNKSKVCYFAAKHRTTILNNLQDVCTNLDIDELQSWFQSYLIERKICKASQLEPLLKEMRQGGESVSNDNFQSMCTKYTVPFIMKSGR